MFSKNYVVGFFVGGLVAAGVALLTTSRSGSETREMIAEKGAELRDKAVSTIEEKRGQLGEIAENVVSKSREQVERLKDVGQEVGAAQREILQQGAHDAQDALASS